MRDSLVTAILIILLNLIFSAMYIPNCHLALVKQFEKYNTRLQTVRTRDADWSLFLEDSKEVIQQVVKILLTDMNSEMAYAEIPPNI